MGKFKNKRKKSAKMAAQKAAQNAAKKAAKKAARKAAKKAAKKSVLQTLQCALENVESQVSARSTFEIVVSEGSLIGEKVFEFLDTSDLLVLCQVSKSLNKSVSNYERPWKLKLKQNSSPIFQSAWEDISKCLSTEGLKKVSISMNQFNIVGNYFHPLYYGIHSKCDQIFQVTFKNFTAHFDPTITDMGHLIAWQIYCSDDIHNFTTLMDYVVTKFGNSGLREMYYLGMKNAIESHRRQICLFFTEVFKRLELTNQVHPLIMAAKQDRFEMYLELCLQFPVKNPLDLFGLTPLHITAKNGNKDFFTFLYDITEDVNASDIFGNTPLHYAVLENDFDITKFILQNKRFDESFLIDSPFNIAINQKSLHMCQLFLENLKNKNPKDSSGYSALHYSAYRGIPSVFFQILYQEKYEDMTPANDGSTILHCAMIGQSYPIFHRMIMLIRENKGEEFPIDVEGQNPLDLAIETRHPNLKAIIRELGREHPPGSCQMCSPRGN